jgi:hypothetical protein
MEPNQDKKQNSAIIAVTIIAILVLVVAWYTFNSSGEDVIPTAANESQEVAQEVETAAEVKVTESAADARLAMAQVEAQAELAIIQARIEAGETYAEVAADLEEIQSNLEVAYANTSVEAQTDWAEAQRSFEYLEQVLRDDTGDALEYFAETSLLLEADVRVDEEDEIGVSEDEV